MLTYLRRNPTLTRIVLITALILFVYSLWLAKARPIETLSLKTGDLVSVIAYKLSRPSAQLENIAIVAIDDLSLKHVGKRWPWPRKVLIELLEKIESSSPKVIGIDLVLMGEGDVTSEDIKLAEFFKKHDNIIIASHFAETGEYIKPQKIFGDSVYGYGHINMPRDRDLVVRRSQSVVFTKARGVLDYSFELKTVATFFGIPFRNIGYYNGYVILKSARGKDKDIMFPVDRNGSSHINFAIGKERIKTIPVWKILQGEVPKGAIEDKVILVGVTSEIFHDIYPTPLGIIPGVLLNANDILMILDNNFLTKLSGWADFLIALLFAMLTICFTYNKSVHNGVFVSLFEIFALMLMAISLRLQDVSFDVFGVIFMIGASYTTIYGYKYISLMIENAVLKKEATTDGLTGLFVYRYFALRLHSEFNRAFIDKNNLSLIIMDIDHFKNLNDTYGHEEGNFVLKELAGLLPALSRKTDILARYGGEEFCIISLDTSLEEAVGFAEKLREQIKKKSFISPSGNTFKITASFGVASNKSDGVLDATSLIKIADAALYEAKRTGRDRVCKV